MINLRQQAEHDLSYSLEGEFKIDVTLIGPDGIEQVYKKGTTEKLGGQVLYFTRRENPITGEVVVVNQPVLSLRISSLNRVPRQGETWYVKMPTSPVAGAPLERFVQSADRAMESGTDIGFLRMYLQRVEDDGAPLS